MRRFEVPPGAAVRVALLALLAVADRSAAAQGPAAATDIGAYARGHAEFSRYAVPGLCRSAALTHQAVLTRTLAARDRLAAAALAHTDTLPDAVAMVARACGARFTAAGVAPRDLPDLFDLALLENNDTLAAAVLERRLTLAADDTARLRVLSEGVTAYLVAIPARVSAAEALITRMTTPSRVAVAARFGATLAVAQYYHGRTEFARAAQAAERVIASARALQPVAFAEHDGVLALQLAGAYRERMTYAWLEAPGTMAEVAQQAQADFARVPAGIYTALARASFGTIPDYSALKGPALVQALAPVRDVTAIGQPAPALAAQVRIPAGTSGAATPGRVMLVVPATIVCDRRLLLSYGGSPLVTQLRQWQTQYGARGLDLTLLQYTTGQTLFTPWTEVADEAQACGHLVRDVLQLPVRLAVRRSAVTTAPAPDGRRFFPQIPRENLVLVGRDGRLVFDGTDVRLLDFLLERALRVPATAGPAPAPAPTSAPASSPASGSAPDAARAPGSAQATGSGATPSTR